MTSNSVCGPAGLLLALALLPSAARAEPPEGAVAIPREPVEQAALHPAASHPLAALSGNWVGGGSISLTGEIKENLRCRATYTFAQASSSLALAIRCASDNYKFELTSNVVERRGQLSGQWSETAYKVSGNITGRVAGNRITAVASGESFTANLSVTTSGNRQTVSIVPQATYITDVQIALNKR